MSEPLLNSLSILEGSDLTYSQKWELFLIGATNDLRCTDRKIMWQVHQFRSSHKGFYASNAWLARRLGETTPQIRKRVSDLCLKGYLLRETTEDGTRVLSINEEKVLGSQVGNPSQVSSPTGHPRPTHGTVSVSPMGHSNIVQVHSSESSPTEKKIPQKRACEEMSRNEDSEGEAERPRDDDDDECYDLDDSIEESREYSKVERGIPFKINGEAAENVSADVEGRKCPVIASRRQTRSQVPQNRSTSEFSTPKKRNTPKGTPSSPKGGGEQPQDEFRTPGGKVTPRNSFPDSPSGRIAKKLEAEFDRRRKGPPPYNKRDAARRVAAIQRLIDSEGAARISALADYWISNSSGKEYVPEPDSCETFANRISKIIKWYERDSGLDYRDLAKPPKIRSAPSKTIKNPTYEERARVDYLDCDQFI